MPLIVAHRGAMAEAPENTQAAFDRAMSCGVDGIEFDVQITRDHRPVVSHDPTLEKISGKREFIMRLSYRELSEYDTGSWFSPKFSKERILTLDQVLQRYGSRTRLMIEIKPPPSPEAKDPYHYLAYRVVNSVRNHISNNKIANIYILSFDPEILQTAYMNDPSLNYILNLESPCLDSHCLNINPEILAGYCLAHTHLNRQFIDRVRHDAKMLMTYSCNSESTLRKLMELMPDVIMTDDPGNPIWRASDGSSIR